jgi:quercetin dioxygenase-like cupin family protein
MSAANVIQVAAPGAGAVVHVLGADLVVKSSGDPRHFFVADHPMPAGYFVPLHAHDDEDEAFFVLEGEITLVSRDGESVAGPGTYIHLPRGVPHGYVNASSAPARILVIASPGGKLEGLFRGLDAAARVAPLVPAQVGAICASHGVRMLPPA